MIVLNDLVSNPANPTGSFVEIFSKSGKLYYMDSSGTAVAVSDPVPSPSGTYTRSDKTGNYTILSSEVTSNTIFTNSGASGSVTLTLPTVGTLGNDVILFSLANFNFILSTAGILKDKAGTSFTTLTASTIGYFARLTYVGSNTWNVDTNGFVFS